ncbi:MAG: hypothetical protein U1E62_13100 [Alsobacter sp.]
MSFLLRVAVVVAVVYSLSPLRTEEGSLSHEAARALADAKARAAAAALAACGEDKLDCLARGAALTGGALHRPRPPAEDRPR